MFLIQTVNQDIQLEKAQTSETFQSSPSLKSKKRRKKKREKPAQISNQFEQQTQKTSSEFKDIEKMIQVPVVEVFFFFSRLIFLQFFFF